MAAPSSALLLLTQAQRPIYPSIATLTDDFTTADTGKWVFAAAASVAGGQLVTPANSSYSGFISSTTRYDLTDSAVSVQLVQRPSAGTGTIQAILALDAGAPNVDTLKWVVEGTGLNAYRYVAGAATLITSLTYGPAAHQYLRVRESGGVVYWDTYDGSTWTQQASWVPAFSLTSFAVGVGSGYYGTESSPGTAIWDNFNVPPASSITGGGDPTAASATLGGSGTLTLAGTGAGAPPTATLSGAGTARLAGTGALSATPAAAAGAGTLRLTGAGGLVGPAATLAGSGTTTAPVTGGGAPAAPPASLNGAGGLTASGTGSLTATPATHDGAGTLRATGTGALSATAGVLNGSGIATAPQFVGGTGALEAPASALSGSGTLRVAATDTFHPHTYVAATLAGNGQSTATLAANAAGTATLAVEAGFGISPFAASAFGGLSTVSRAVLTPQPAGTATLASNGVGTATLASNGTSTATVTEAPALAVLQLV